MPFEFAAALQDGGTHYSVLRNGTRCSWAEVIAAWRSDFDFAMQFSRALASSGYPAFFWECAPISSTRLSEPFECVTLLATDLEANSVDPTAFASVFEDDLSKGLIVTTRNISGDALLVIPRDRGGSRFGHLGQFLREGADEQICALWRETGHAIAGWIEQTPEHRLWLSTSGLGVSWLHVRLDKRPKYFNHLPYRA